MMPTTESSGAPIAVQIFQGRQLRQGKITLFGRKVHLMLVTLHPCKIYT